MPNTYHQSSTSSSPKRVRFSHPLTFEKKQSRTTKSERVECLSPITVSQLSMIGRIHTQPLQYQNNATQPSSLLFTPSNLPRPHQHYPDHDANASRHAPHPSQQTPLNTPRAHYGSSVLYDPRNTVTLPPPSHHRTPTMHPSTWSASRPRAQASSHSYSQSSYSHDHDESEPESDRDHTSDSESSSFGPLTPPGSPCPYTMAPCMRTVPLPNVSDLGLDHLKTFP